MHKWSLHWFTIHYPHLRHKTNCNMNRTLNWVMMKRESIRWSQIKVCNLSSFTSRESQEWRLNGRLLWTWLSSNIIHSKNIHLNMSLISFILHDLPRSFIHWIKSPNTHRRPEDGDSFASQNPRDPKQHLHECRRRMTTKPAHDKDTSVLHDNTRPDTHASDEAQSKLTTAHNTRIITIHTSDYHTSLNNAVIFLHATKACTDRLLHLY